MRTRPSLRRLGVLLALGCAAFAVSCSDDDSDGDDGGAATTTTATTVPATSTTRAAAQQSIVVGRHGILGWWEDGLWVQADAAEPTPLRAGDELSLVRLDGLVEHATVVVQREPEEFCGTPQVELDPAFPEPSDGNDPLDPIAVHGVEDPRPRSATMLDPAAAVYREAAADVLADLGVEDPDPMVVQVVRADLAGDGTDEVLVVAEQVADPEALIAAPGDYSVLFLRQLVDGDVRTTVVDEHRTVEDSGPYLLSHRVGTLADLNGDGLLEVVVQTRYYEGAGTHVYALDPDGRLQEVLAAGCGV